MRKLSRFLRVSILALVVLSLPCSLMAAPVQVLINDTPSGIPDIQIIGAPDGWTMVPDEIDPAVAESGLIAIWGVDQAGQVPELGWRFTVPNAPIPLRNSVDIVWIEHHPDTGDLVIGFDSATAGNFFRSPELAGDINAGTVTDLWVTLYADEVLVLKFKPHTYRLRD